jgi:signal transduction histidine kinase
LDNIEPAETVALQEECRRLTEALRLAEQDRQHLLYEIHDGVLQDLTAASLMLDGADRKASSAGGEAVENFSRGLRLLRASIAEARRLVRGTAIDALTADGLLPALERLVAKAKSDLQLPASLVSNCEELRVPISVQHLLVRIVQESLVNVWKHARATEVDVQLTQREDCLEIVIADNGVGFDPAAVPPGHFGLASIRARAAAMSADLVFDTAPNHGTRVVVRLNEHRATSCSLPEGLRREGMRNTN